MGMKLQYDIGTTEEEKRVASGPTYDQIRGTR
jgi:hypothetical protein